MPNETAKMTRQLAMQLLMRRLDQRDAEQSAQQAWLMKQQEKEDDQRRKFELEGYKARLKAAAGGTPVAGGGPLEQELGTQADLSNISKLALGGPSQAFTEAVARRGIQGDPTRLNQLSQNIEAQKGAQLQQRVQKQSEAEIAETVADRGKQRTAIVDGLASQMVIHRVSGSEEPNEGLLDAVGRLREFSGGSQKLTNKLYSRAMAKADEEEAKFILQRELKTIESKTDFMASAESLARAQRGKANPLDWAKLVMKNEAIKDPIDGEYILTEGGDPTKLRESRIALNEMIVRLPNLSQSWDDLVANADGTVGPVVGEFQELYRLFGVQNPHAAYYSSQMFEFISTLLKMRQGSRPSDFDLRMYMGLLPRLTEVGSPAAEFRFKAMEDSLGYARDAHKSRETTNEVQKMRSKEWTAEDKAMRAAVESARNVLNSDSATDSQKRRAVAKVMTEVDKWSGVRGEQFQVVKPEVMTSDNFKAADEFLQGRGN